MREELWGCIRQEVVEILRGSKLVSMLLVSVLWGGRRGGGDQLPGYLEEGRGKQLLGGQYQFLLL